MNIGRLFGVVLVAIVIIVAIIVMRSGGEPCASEETVESVLALLQKNGKINFIDGDWLENTSLPQFAKVDMTAVSPAPSGSKYACRGTVVVDYNPEYAQRELAEAGQPPAASARLHREFALDYTPTWRAESGDLSLQYQLTPK